MTTRPFSRCRIARSGDERLGELGHRDRRLHARGDVDLLQGILQRQRVHDRREHAHVVGAVALDAGCLPAAPDVAAADHDRGLDAEVDDLGQLPRHEGGGVGVMPHSASAGANASPESFNRTRLYVGRRRRRRWSRSTSAPRSSPSDARSPCLLGVLAELEPGEPLHRTFSPTFAPTSSSNCWMVLLSSFTNGWSSRTLSLKKASILPSTIFVDDGARACPTPAPAPRQILLLGLERRRRARRRG